MPTDTNIKSFPCWSTSSTLTVEPEFHDSPELAGVYIEIKEANEVTRWATDDPAVAKQLIEHIAKLAHLTVTIGEPEPKIEDFKPGDRVKITAQHRFFKGREGTVSEAVPVRDPWPITVWFENGESEIFDPHELTKNF